MMEMTNTEAFVLALGALFFGIVLLIRGGNWAIDGAVFVARHIGISPLVVGFTILAFGTSLPELIVSVNANIHGSPEIAFGNVLGSNIANILLVIGATAAVATLHAVPRDLLRDLGMMILATALLAILMMNGVISRWAGTSMVLLLLVYTLWQYIMAKKGHIEAELVEEPEFKNMRSAILYLAIGMACIAGGAEFLVRGASISAIVIGVPEAVIALSVIAIGTSLPELSTCLIAARKGHTDLILGNIIGSNVFNILMIIGVTAMIKPLTTEDVAPQLVDLDIWITMGVSVLFTAILLIFRKVHQFTGYAFLAAYIAYIVAIFALYMT